MPKVSAKSAVDASTPWVSFDGLRWASMQMARTDLTPIAKLVLFAMASHVRAEYEVWPSLQRLAVLVGSSRMSVIRAVDQLVDIGLVAKESRTGDDGVPISNLYRLNVTWSQIVTTPGHNSSPSVVTKCDLNEDHTDQDQQILVEGTRARAMRLVDLQTIWNAHRGPLPAWDAMTSSRQRAGIARLAEMNDPAQWTTVVQNIAKSAFCVDRKLGPDFLLRGETWPRALSGEILKWGQTNGKPSSAAEDMRQRVDRANQQVLAPQMREWLTGGDDE